MKAIVQDRYGSPEVLRLEDVDKPVIAAGKVDLVRSLGADDVIDYQEQGHARGKVVITV